MILNILEKFHNRTFSQLILYIDLLYIVLWYQKDGLLAPLKCTKADEE